MDQPPTEVKTAQIDKIVCAFDFSETAEVALEQAKRFARRHEAALVLAHVVEPIPLGPYPILIAPENELAIVDLARQRVAELVDVLNDDGTRVESIVREGEPGKILVDLAEELGSDLMVVGTRGLSGLKHLALGSTAEHVVRRCPCPVLTVHPEDRLLRDAIETVVLPTDLSGGAPFTQRSTSCRYLGHGSVLRSSLSTPIERPPYLDALRHDTLRIPINEMR